MADKPGTGTDGAGSPAPTGVADPSQTSGADKGSPPADALTLTKAQADALAAKAVNDALAARGRDVKTIEDERAANKTERETLTAERAELKRRQEAAEDAAARDNPDEFEILKRRRELSSWEDKLKAREAAATTKEKAFEERDKELGSISRVALANTIAAELDVAAEVVLEHGGDTEESMRKLGKALPKLGKKPAELPPDSGAGGGGGTRTQAESLKLRYPTMH